MSVIFQYAGKAINDKTDELAVAFAQMEKGLRKEPGFERAVLLVSRLTLQCQLLFQWSAHEYGLAFNKKFQLGLSERFARLLESRGTLITSVLEEEIGAVPLARKAADGAEDGQVTLHFSGTALPADIPRARAILHDEIVPLLATCPQYRGLSVLANHQDGKLQFLATFDGFEASFAWVRGNAQLLLTPFDAVVREPSLPSFFAVRAEISRLETQPAG